MRLIKRKSSISKIPVKSMVVDRYKNVSIDPFTIVIPFSVEYLSSLNNCLYYLDQCKQVGFCEVILVLYQNEFVDLNFSSYRHLDIRLIHSRRNNVENIFCLSHARNIGIVNAKYDWVLCCDGDILFPDNLCLALSSFKKDDNKLYWTDRFNLGSFKSKISLSEVSRFIRFVDSAPYGYFHFFNRKTVMDRVGGYDESMRGWGSEDNDFVNRCVWSGMISESIRDFVRCFHVIHEYNDHWKNGDHLHFNSVREGENRENIKKENVGIIHD